MHHQQKKDIQSWETIEFDHHQRKPKLASNERIDLRRRLTLMMLFKVSLLWSTLRAKGLPNRL